jgi:cyclase
MAIGPKARLIPCLLLGDQGCVKTIRFREPTYLGDPINIVRIFNDREVDELVVLDITATPQGRGPRLDLLSDLASECFIPLCYGGGVRSLDDMRKLFAPGVEKVALNSRAAAEPSLVSEAAAAFGSSSVVVAIDVRKNLFGRQKVFTHGGRKGTGRDPVAYAREMAERGAGEIFLNSVDRDGTMEGYDLELIAAVSSAVGIPIIACGGAGRLDHVAGALRAGATAVAAGSLFCFAGPHRAVLISYPERAEIDTLLEAASHP